MHTANRQLQFGSADKRPPPADRMLNDATNVSPSPPIPKHKMSLARAPPSQASPAGAGGSSGVTVTTSSTEHLSDEELRLLQKTRSLFLCCRNIHAIKHIQYLELLKDHLRVLNLHMNCIRQLEPSTFQLYLTNLVELDLSANELHSLEASEDGEEEEAVGGPVGLLRRRLPPSPGKSRRGLDGKENRHHGTTPAAPSCFVGLVHLRRLNLSSNYLKFLHRKETFAPLVALEWISLAYNQLEDIVGLQGIPAGSAPHGGGSKLYHVDLASNCLPRVEQVLEALGPHRHSIRELRLETTAVNQNTSLNAGAPLPPTPFLKENPFCQVERDAGAYTRDDVDAFPYSDVCFAVFDNLQVLNGLSCQVNPLDDIQRKQQMFEETHAEAALDDLLRQEAPLGKASTCHTTEGQAEAPRRKPFASRKERGDTPAPSGLAHASPGRKEGEEEEEEGGSPTAALRPMLTPPQSLKTLQTLNLQQQQQQQQQHELGATGGDSGGSSALKRKKSASTSSPLSVKKGKAYFSKSAVGQPQLPHYSLQVSPSTTNSSARSPPSSPEQDPQQQQPMTMGGGSTTPKSALKWKPKMISRGTNTEAEPEDDAGEPTEPSSFLSHATDDTGSVGSGEDEERARRRRRRERRRERRTRAEQHHHHADAAPPGPQPPAPAAVPVPVDEAKERKEREREEETELLKLRLARSEEQVHLHTVVEYDLRTQLQRLQERLLQEQQQTAIRERQQKGQVAALKDELLRRGEELQLMASKYRADAAEEKRQLQESLTQQLQHQRQQEVGQLEAALQALQSENKKVQETLRTQNAGWNDFLRQLEGEEKQREQARRQALQQLQAREGERTRLLLEEQAARHQLEREAADVLQQAPAQLYASWFRLSQRTLSEVHDDWQEQQQVWERYAAGLQEEHQAALAHATAEAAQLREEVRQLRQEKQKAQETAEAEVQVEELEISHILPPQPAPSAAATVHAPSTAYWKETCERVEHEKRQLQRALQVLQESQEALQHQNTYLLDRMSAVTKEKDALQRRLTEQEKAAEGAEASHQLEKGNMVRTIHNLEEDLQKKDKLMQLIEEEAKEKIQSKREQIAALQEQLDLADIEKEKILSRSIKYTEEVEQLRAQVRQEAMRDTEAARAREVEGQAQQQRLLSTLRQAREQLVKEHRAHEGTRHALQLREAEVAEVKRELELLRERARSKEAATRAALAQLMLPAGDV